MPNGVKHKLLLAASEVVGFAKTGGLADVAGALPRTLSRRGHQCAIILPLYNFAQHGKVPGITPEHALSLPLGHRAVPGVLLRATLPDPEVSVYLVWQAQ